MKMSVDVFCTLLLNTTTSTTVYRTHTMGGLSLSFFWCAEDRVARVRAVSVFDAPSSRHLTAVFRPCRVLPKREGTSHSKPSNVVASDVFITRHTGGQNQTAFWKALCGNFPPPLTRPSPWFWVLVLATWRNQLTGLSSFQYSHPTHSNNQHSFFVETCEPTPPCVPVDGRCVYTTLLPEKMM